MKFLIILLFSLLAGCSTFIPAEKQDRITVEHHQKRFVELSQGKVSMSQVKRIPIYIKPFKSFNLKTKKWERSYTNVVGICYTFGPLSFIQINEYWWKENTNELEREQLIFHELAHCILYEHHTQPTSSEGFMGWVEGKMFDWGFFKARKKYLRDYCPSSYMNPSVLGRECISKHYDYYIEELFKRTTREIYENGY